MKKLKYTVDEFFNPFIGNKSDDVWAKIKANKKPIDKEKVLQEVKRQYLSQKVIKK